MKLASLKSGRDGRLLVVASDLEQAVAADAVAPTLQVALDDWSNAAPRLQELSDALNAGRADGAFALDQAALCRSEGWLARAGWVWGTRGCQLRRRACAIARICFRIAHF